MSSHTYEHVSVSTRSFHIFYLTMSSKSASNNTVTDIITKGFLERGAQYAAIGFTGGLMASLVLAAGGRGTASRKAITAFGTGIGLGM